MLLQDPAAFVALFPTPISHSEASYGVLTEARICWDLTDGFLRIFSAFSTGGEAMKALHHVGNHSIHSFAISSWLTRTQTGTFHACVRTVENDISYVYDSIACHKQSASQKISRKKRHTL